MRAALAQELSVKMKDVWVNLGNQSILQSIDLEVPTETILTIVGPNGSGKSTLLKTMLGQIEPSQGSITLLGESPAYATRKGWIGYLPQHVSEDNDFPILTRDIVALSRFALKKPFQKLKAVDWEMVDEALEQVEMHDYYQKPFSHLSGGQQQRVLIARALAMNPRLMLLDEPSTGLDMVAQESFYKLLQRLKTERKMSIIMVSHDIGSVSGFVDQIACLNRKIHFHGSPQSTVPRHAVEQVFGKHVRFILHDDHCKTCEKSK